MAIVGHVEQKLFERLLLNPAMKNRNQRLEIGLARVFTRNFTFTCCRVMDENIPGFLHADGRAEFVVATVRSVDEKLALVDQIAGGIRRIRFPEF